MTAPSFVQGALTSKTRGGMIAQKQSMAMATASLASMPMTGGKGWGCTWLLREVSQLLWIE